MVLSTFIVLVSQSYTTLWTPWIVAHQASLSMGFSRREYWSGLPFPPPGDLPDPGIECGSPALEADSLPMESWGILVNARGVNMTKHDPCKKEFAFHWKYFRVLKSQSQINLSVPPLTKEKQRGREKNVIYIFCKNLTVIGSRTLYHQHQPAWIPESRDAQFPFRKPCSHSSQGPAFTDSINHIELMCRCGT